MGELKPLGSEKLSGNDKLKRILEITYYKDTVNENKKSKIDYDLIVEGKTSVYGIQKEKDGYYVKKGINESSLDYIGGLFMKNKNRFSSYNEALKRLEYIKGQDELNESTKYILKNNTVSKPTDIPVPASKPVPAPAPVPSPTPEPSKDTAPELPQDLAPTEEPTPYDTEGMDNDGLNADVEDSDNTLKDIQRLSGKLSQKLRDYDKEIESDDIKYVINMILSAVDVEKLDDEDKEEILSKIEGEDESNDEFDQSSGEESPETGREDELGETFDTLEDLTNANFDFDDDNEKYINLDDDEELDEQGYFIDNYFDDEIDPENSDNYYDIEGIGDVQFDSRFNPKKEFDDNDDEDEEDYNDKPIFDDDEDEEDYNDKPIFDDDEDRELDELLGLDNDYGTSSKKNKRRMYDVEEDDTYKMTKEFNDIFDDPTLDDFSDQPLNENVDDIIKKYKIKKK